MRAGEATARVEKQQLARVEKHELSMSTPHRPSPDAALSELVLIDGHATRPQIYRLCASRAKGSVCALWVPWRVASREVALYVKCGHCDNIVKRNADPVHLIQVMRARSDAMDA